MTKESLQVLSDKTLVPISLLAGIMVGALWIGTISSQGKENSASIERIRESIRTNQGIALEISTRLARIEGSLTVIEHSLGVKRE